MSNRRNYRRGEERRTEHGPRRESPDPGKGCNSTHVAKARARRKRRIARRERRAAKKLGWIVGEEPPESDEAELF